MNLICITQLTYFIMKNNYALKCYTSLVTLKNRIYSFLFKSKISKNATLNCVGYNLAPNHRKKTSISVVLFGQQVLSFLTFFLLFFGFNHGFAQADYTTKTFTSKVQITNDLPAGANSMPETLRKEYPFVEVGDGEWETINVLDVVDLGIKAELGVGLYVQLKDKPIGDVRYMSLEYDFEATTPQQSNYLLNEELTLTPESYKLKEISTAIIRNKDIELEIGLYIKAGAAMRASGAGSSANLFSAPSNFRNDSNPTDVDIPLFVLKNNQIEVPPSVPEVIRKQLQKVLNDRTLYSHNFVDGFDVNIPDLGFVLKYHKNDVNYFKSILNPRYSDHYDFDKEQPEFYVNHSYLYVDFSITDFIDYFINKRLKFCMKTPFCKKFKLIKGIFLRYQKNFYIGEIDHRSLSLSANEFIELHNTVKLLTKPKLEYHFSTPVGSDPLLFNVYAKDNPTSILRTVDQNNVILGFDEIAKVIHPGEGVFDAFSRAPISARPYFDDFKVSQTLDFRRRNGFNFRFFFGELSPSELLNSFVSIVTAGEEELEPFNYGPLYEANFFANTDSFNIFADEESNIDPSFNTIFYTSIGDLKPSNVIFTDAIDGEVIITPNGLATKDLYPLRTDGLTFTPAVIDTEGNHTISVSGSVPHTFTLTNFIDNVPPQINDQVGFEELMGGFRVSDNEPVKYHKVNTSSLVNATNADGTINDCAFKLNNIANDLKNVLIDKGSNPISDVNVSVVTDENSIDINNAFIGKHEITYVATDHYGNENAFVQYVEIVNDFVPDGFVISTPDITEMVDENGQLELTLGETNIYDDDDNLIETTGIPYTINNEEKLCGKEYQMRLSQAIFDCNDFGLNTIEAILTIDGQEIRQTINLTVVNNPDLEFTEKTMYINKFATGNNTGVSMENGFVDLNQAINVLPCRIANVDQVYIRHGDYFAFSEEVDYSTFSGGDALSTFNKIYVTKDMVFESVGGVSTLKLSNFFIEDGVTATFRNIDFTNSTIIAGKNSKVILENCNFFANQFAIVSVGSVEAYNTTFVNSQGGSVDYEGPGFSSEAFGLPGSPLFKIEDPDGDCTVTNIYGAQEALQDISLFYLYGGEETSKFINCTFHSNVTTFNGAPAGMYCNTQVEFSNCLFDAILSSQSYQGDFFGIGNNVQITLNNNFITGQEPDDPSRPGFEESICNNPSIICNNNTFFDDEEYLGWFPGPNFYDFEDPIGDESDGNPFNYNLRLKESSVAIDAGDNNYYLPPVTITTDLGGESRICGNSIDVGAYEYQNCPIDDNTDEEEEGDDSGEEDESDDSGEEDESDGSGEEQGDDSGEEEESDDADEEEESDDSGEEESDDSDEEEESDDSGEEESDDAGEEDENDNADEDVSVFPVPFNNQINISTVYVGKTTYSLFDETGNLVRRGELLSANRKINTGNLSTGVYVLVLQFGHNIVTQKIIKN